MPAVGAGVGVKTRQTLLTHVCMGVGVDGANGRGVVVTRDVGWVVGVDRATELSADAACTAPVLTATASPTSGPLHQALCRMMAPYSGWDGLRRHATITAIIRSATPHLLRVRTRAVEWAWLPKETE